MYLLVVGEGMGTDCVGESVCDFMKIVERVDEGVMCWEVEDEAGIGKRKMGVLGEDEEEGEKEDLGHL
jgi:hypothetical protein